MWRRQTGGDRAPMGERTRHLEMRSSHMWFRTLRVVLVAIFSLGASSYVRSQTPTPDTPAGRTLRAFLDAFNSDELPKLQEYVKEYGSPQSAEDLQRFSGQTGGFTLLSIKSSNPDSITFMVNGRGDHLTAFGSLRLATVDPPKVKTLSIRAIPSGATVEQVPLTPQMRATTIRAISERLTTYYVYPDVAKQMVSAMEAHEKAGDYNAITDGEDFANALMHDLRAVSHDKHLFVGYAPYTMPDRGKSDRPQPPPTAAERTEFRKAMEHDNCGFSKIEILPGNIGYLKFGEFGDPEICGPVVAAAMTFLVHTDALIFDLRENHGGSPAMVQVIVSYLFEAPTHINDMLNQHDETIQQYWTLPSLAGPRFLDKPVYVLTSSQTFSGGEEFTYDLQTQKRATIVGEVTGGGAHPVNGMSAGDHFMIGVPVGRPINPITKKDWEGTGVTPDVKVPATEALEIAQRLAKQKIAESNSGATSPGAKP